MRTVRTYFALLLAGSALVFSLGGCATAPLPTDLPLVTNDPQLSGVAVKDKVVVQDRLAAQALRAGRYDEARTRLDDVILSLGGIIANDAAAAKARSLWAGEDRKVFLGEPYERVMAYFYRGLLYWRDGEPDNARACFRTGEFLDSDAENQAYRGDYVLLDYLDGLAGTRLNEDGSDAYRRAVETAKHPLPAYDPAARVLVVAEWGRGPLKYGSGVHGEQLKFDVVETPVRSVTLTVDGRTVRIPAYDDLNFQATTRGGRVMDYILGRKAVFKTSTQVVGDVALVGSAVAAQNIYRDDGEINHGAANTAMALAAIGIISKVVSASADANADTRAWDNLPQKIGFAALALPPGEHPATVKYYDADGNLLPAKTSHLSILVPAENSGDILVFISDLAKHSS